MIMTRDSSSALEGEVLFGLPAVIEIFFLAFDEMWNEESTDEEEAGGRGDSTLAATRSNYNLGNESFSDQLPLVIPSSSSHPASYTSCAPCAAQYCSVIRIAFSQDSCPSSRIPSCSPSASISRTKPTVQLPSKSGSATPCLTGS